MKIGAAAKAAASLEVEISAVNSSFGPAGIEGYFDEVFSIPGLIKEIGKAAGADTFVIACFDDTGRDAARYAATALVVGVGEAARNATATRRGRSSLTRASSSASRRIDYVVREFDRRASWFDRSAARERVRLLPLSPAHKGRRSGPLKSPILEQVQLIVTAPNRRQPRRRQLT